MGTDGFFFARLEQMIDLRLRRALLRSHMPRANIEAALATGFVHHDRKD